MSIMSPEEIVKSVPEQTNEEKSYSVDESMFDMVAHIHRFVCQMEHTMSEIQANPMARNMLSSMGLTLYRSTSGSE